MADEESVHRVPPTLPSWSLETVEVDSYEGCRSSVGDFTLEARGFLLTPRNARLTLGNQVSAIQATSSYGTASEYFQSC